MKESTFKRLTGLLYALIIVALAALFFTNDFGLVDLRKTSVIIAVGLDSGDDGNLTLTAQLAVPQPAENGENTQFAAITGSGKTVAGALNEINVKTGYYPKLVFCKLVLLGESCLDKDVAAMLNYFYENEYTGLTPKIAACAGKAQDVLSLSLPYGDSSTDFIERLLSDEAQKSSNVSDADLNSFGQGYYSQSRSSYMPYITVNGMEEDSSGGSGGEQQGGSSQSGGGSSGGGQSGGSQKSVEFVCNRTAVFTGGVCRGVLDEKQTFALNLIENDVRHAFVESGEGEERTVLGLRGCKGGASLSIEAGEPVLKLSFSAAAKLIDDAKKAKTGDKGEGRTSDEKLKQCGEEIKARLESLFEYLKSTSCDALGVTDMLYKYNKKYYGELKDGLWERLTLKTEVKLRSSG